MKSPLNPGFFVAPFDPTGEGLGIGFWRNSSLSQKWLKITAQFLADRDSTFDDEWEGNLQRIRTRLTSTSGAAIATFYVNGSIANSMLMLSSVDPEADQSVLHLFMESICRAPLILSPETLKMKLRQLSERPLLVVFVWGDPAISELDQNIVQELSLHFAAAFFINHGRA